MESNVQVLLVDVLLVDDLGEVPSVVLKRGEGER